MWENIKKSVGCILKISKLTTWLLSSSTRLWSAPEPTVVETATTRWAGLVRRLAAIARCWVGGAIFLFATANKGNEKQLTNY